MWLLMRNSDNEHFAVELEMQGSNDDIGNLVGASTTGFNLNLLEGRREWPGEIDTSLESSLVGQTDVLAVGRGAGDKVKFEHINEALSQRILGEYKLLSIVSDLAERQMSSQELTRVHVSVGEENSLHIAESEEVD